MALVLVCLLLVNCVPETWDVEFRSSRRWVTAYAVAFVIAYLFMNGRESLFLYYQF
jgi:hypothetical protein